MKKQRGFTSMKNLLSLSAIAFILAAVGGWIVNIVKLVGMINGPITGLFIARIIGAFAPPFGAILGYL